MEVKLKTYPSHGLNTLGPLCLWQCLEYKAEINSHQALHFCTYMGVSKVQTDQLRLKTGTPLQCSDSDLELMNLIDRIV